jgi:hypothetical protein
MALIKAISKRNKNAASTVENAKTRLTKWAELLRHVSTAVSTKLLYVRNITAGLAI